MKTKQKKNPAPKPTEFQQRVYAATAKIPRGKVSTYQLLARHVGCGSCQAVGQALKRNPYAPHVPCHRVIAADGSLGGFQGRRGGAALRRKLCMLAEEGVVFEGGFLKDMALLFRFE